MADNGDGHSHAHAAAGACHGGHDHGYHRADGDAQALVEDVSLEDDDGADWRRRQAAASAAGANLSEAEANQRKLKRATAFVLVFFVVEIIGGVWSGSLAIISDAAHLLADVSGFILAMVANEIASRPACDKLTYGPVRAEVLSALFSTVTILAISLFLVVEAIGRIIAFWRGEGEEIDGKLMSFIALLGLFVNLALLGIFGHEHGGHDHSHGHGHGHAHDDHDDHDHNHHDHDDHDGHNDHDSHDEEQGLVAAPSPGKSGKGVDERSSLVDSITGGAVGALATPEPNSLDISGSSSASSVGGSAARGGGRGGGSIQYGSLGVGNGKGEEAALVATGVAEFPYMPVAGVSVAGGGKGGEGESVRIKKDKTKNINMEAAVLHAVTDLVQSVGVLVAGLLIWYDPRWKWADPIATLFFVGLVVNSTRWLLRRAFNVLLEGVPDSIDYDQLRNRLSEIEGVTDLHCLHVWSLTLGRTVVSAHLKATDPEQALASAHEICEDMGVAHSTIQVQVDHCLPESCTHPCVSAVGKCCGPEGMGGSPLSTSRRAISPTSVEAS